jgi:hypothetical protein
MTLIELFGSPDDVQPLSIGGGGVGPGGGFGGDSSGASPGNVGGGGGGGGDTAMRGMLGDPFGQGLNQARPGAVPGAGGGGGGGGQGLGVPGRGGAAPGAGGGGTAANTDAQRVVYTRWVYKRGSSRYAFVVDKFNRVVQIEAIGMSDGRVNTSRGIRFGSTFASIIKAYNVPDAYEISGDSIVVRYLVRDHVAFKLSRLKADEPHRVTGIVVAAGKS